MEDLFNSIKYISPFVLIVSLLLSSIWTIIKYYGVTFIEEKLMTNVEKSRIYLSILIIITIFIMLLILIFYPDIIANDKGKVVLNTQTIVAFVITSIAIGFIISFCIFIGYVGAKYLFSLDKILVARLDNNKNEWSIIKRTPDNKLLIKSGNGTYRVLSEWSHLEINIKYTKYGKRFRWFYGNEFSKTRINILLGVNTAVSFLAGLLSVLLAKSVIYIPIIFTLYVYWLYSIVIVFKEYDDYYDSENNKRKFVSEKIV